MTLLKLEDLHVEIEHKEVVKGVSLEVEAGEIHLLFGPNGSGKSTLLRAVMGLPSCTISKGRVIFEGRDITTLKAYERALLGIALMHQNPRPLSVKLRQMVVELSRKFGSDPELIRDLNLDGLMDRELHKGFSGGELKRAELALVLLQRPKLALLDEPDSGVDLESLRLVGRIINEMADHGVAVLLVTHTGAVAEHLRNVAATHVLVNGRIVASGELPSILRTIRHKGYSAFEG
ncbi:MAG: ABC transporter ATP-binding protein [Thermofilaceae archaeon]